MPKTVTITIPDNEYIPDIITTFSPEENILMLKIGSDCLREGRNVVAGLTQKEIYNKINDNQFLINRISSFDNSSKEFFYTNQFLSSLETMRSRSFGCTMSYR